MARHDHWRRQDADDQSGLLLCTVMWMENSWNHCLTQTGQLIGPGERRPEARRVNNGAKAS